MATTAIKEKLLQGAEFLVKSTSTESVFIPEDANEEQKMIQDMVGSFVKGEVWPVVDRLEKLEEGLAASLMEKLGELGLLGTHMPEEYGGMNLDFNTNTMIGEKIGPSGAFSVSYNAHTGIGMLPILYYGSDEQKNKYLPKLISGEYKASYCLTEPGSGSDALAAKSKAVLSDDGKHYILNGQKMWISNAGFADIFTVFAQVDGEKFTGFILEKGMEGLTLGAEEKKMGIKGSSTRLVFMENVKVPVENVLGEIGKGHLIAFNVLNTGRFKLGASCVGGMKGVIDTSVAYANERIQFKKPISSFGAIQSKIAEMVTNTFAADSVVYRCSGQINDKVNELKAEGNSFGEAKRKAAEEYALECSIIKIVASEVLDFCVDEGVQIHGGMGYSEEGTIARAYRDSRINRIFEGTNEINKMVIINTLFKKAMKGKLDIVTPALAVQSELMSGSIEQVSDKAKYNQDYQALSNFKKVMMMILGSVGKLAMEQKINLREEQELLMSMSKIVEEIYTVESLLLRIHRLSNIGSQQSDIYDAMLRLYIYEANERVQKSAYDAIGIFVEEDQLPLYIKGVKLLTKYPIQNIRDLKRIIAAPVIAANEYVF